jgi:hypothetical protein
VELHRVPGGILDDRHYDRRRPAGNLQSLGQFVHMDYGDCKSRSVPLLFDTAS